MLKFLQDKCLHMFAAALLAAILMGQPLLSHASGFFGGVPPSTVLRQASLLNHKADLESFYKENNDNLLWQKKGRARDALKILEESWTQGLNPARYHAAEISALLGKKSLTNEEEAQLDILLTDAAVSYGRDMTGMRVRAADVGEKASYWRQPEKPESILRMVAASSDPVKTLHDMAPQNSLYEKMRKELARLAAESNDYDHLLPMKFGGKLFKPREKHKDVVALRKRLGLPHNPDTGPEQYYDDSLASAVMRFQKERNLTPDGIIGPNTLALLNRTNKNQIEQLVANMERMRWMDQQKPERYILVNIPSQMLWAIENGKTVHEMPVVVGQVTRQTKSFKTEITGIRFNPTWTVPMGIKIKDMIPKLQENPHALADKGIDMYRNGKNIDPASIDWANISRSELVNIRMMQHPGDNNALGKIRVLMPNEYDIYLHDTNHRELFVKDERLLSSGCVRLSEPAKIASFVLSKNKDWSDEKMNALIDAGRLVEVPVDTKIPVYIIYQSVWLDDRGQLVFGADVYKKDKKLIEALRSMDGYSIAQDDTSVKSSKLASSVRNHLN